MERLEQRLGLLGDGLVDPHGGPRLPDRELAASETHQVATHLHAQVVAFEEVPDQVGVGQPRTSIGADKGHVFLDLVVLNLLIVPCVAISNKHGMKLMAIFNEIKDLLFKGVNLTDS